MPKASACAALLATLACSDPDRDLGRTRDNGPPDALRNSQCEEDTDDAQPADKLQQPPATLLSEFEGRWLGDAEDALGELDLDGALPVYAFPSGSTRILLEVSDAGGVSAKLTFGAPGAVQVAPSALAPGVPAEGVPYAAEPIASAFDAQRAGASAAEHEQPALDGKLVLAFSTDEQFVSELHLRFGGAGLIGVFDGLSLLNARGFQTRPGSVRFRRLTAARRPE